MVRTRVVFPLPLSPTMPRISPLETLKETSSNAVWSRPPLEWKTFVTERTSRRGDASLIGLPRREGARIEPG